MTLKEQIAELSEAYRKKHLGHIPKADIIHVTADMDFKAGANAMVKILDDYLQQRVKELDRNGGVRAPGSGDRIQELELAIKHFTL